MPRKNLIRTNEFPYHITARSNNKDNFYLPIELIWKVFVDLIIELEKPQWNCKIPSYVLMNNHFHICIWTRNSNLDQVMHFFMTRMAQKINKLSGRINHVFGGPYKWCLIQDDNYYLNVLRYICQNPLRAKIINKIEDYPYLKIPDTALVNKHMSYDEMITWLNYYIPLEEQNGLHLALRKRVFKLGRNPETFRPYRIVPQKGEPHLTQFFLSE